MKFLKKNLSGKEDSGMATSSLFKRMRQQIPGLVALILLSLCVWQFQKAASSGKYYVLHTLLLYSSAFATGGAVIHVWAGKAKKVLLLNWVLIFLLLSSVEIFLRITDFRSILNYSERNEGHFTTMAIQYERALDSRHAGDLLYLNIKDSGDYTMSRPEFSFTYRLDRFGLNHPGTCQQGGAYKILALGDSFTWGMGASADSSWPAALQKGLKAKGVNNVSICNGGVPGADPAYNFYSYRKIYQKTFEPDLLIVAFNVSDISDYIIRGGNKRYQPGFETAVPSPIWLPWYASSLIFRLYMQNIFQIDPVLLISEQKKQEVINTVFTEIFETFLDISRYQLLRNKTVVFAHTPTYHDVLEGTAFMADLVSEGKSIGLNIIDLTPYFLQQKVNSTNYRDYFWEHDTHNTGKGYEIIGAVLAEYLTVNQLLKL
jgi:lysophospholipase L1-like esterase